MIICEIQVCLYIGHEPVPQILEIGTISGEEGS